MQLRTLTHNVKMHGIRATASMYGHFAAREIAGIRTLRGMVLEAPVPALTSIDAPYRARFLDKKELQDLAERAALEYDLSPEFVETALDRGDFCFAVLASDVVAAYGWYTARPVRMDRETELTFDPSFIYMYAGFTHPRYRGRRLHATGMGLACVHFRKRGHRGLISYVDATNLSSWRSCLRLGYRHFGNVYRLQIAGRSLAWSDGGCREYKFHVRRAGWVDTRR